MLHENHDGKMAKHEGRMKIIKQREHKQETDYYRFYSADGNSGFSFECDKDGALTSSPSAGFFGSTTSDGDEIERVYENQKITMIITSPNGEISTHEFPFQGVRSSLRTWIEPAIGRCNHCGTRVHLHDPLDNDCEGCGANYNMSGQEVRHSMSPFNDEPYYDDY